MSLVLENLSGRGEAIVQWNWQAFDQVSIVRAVVTGVVDTAIDQSLRYNPTWYTLGHLSIRHQETLLWQTFLNFPDQLFWVHDYIDRPASIVGGQFALSGGVGLSYQYDADEDGISGLTVAWQMRGNANISQLWFEG